MSSSEPLATTWLARTLRSTMIDTDQVQTPPGISAREA